MNISETFIRKPVATTLLLAAIGLAGGVTFNRLPVSPLPQVDFPTISVNANLPGASPETMAAAVATPLERQFGRIAGVAEMTSSSSLGSTNVTLQFELDRNIDAAARDVQAAINAARGYLPANLPSNPGYRKVNPADSPIMILALTSDSLSKGQMYDAASTIIAQKLAQVPGIGQVIVGGGSLPGVRLELNPAMLNKYGVGFEQVRSSVAATNANMPKGYLSNGARTWEVGANDQLLRAIDYAPLIVAYHNGAAVRLRDVGDAEDSVEDIESAGYVNGKPAVMVIVFRQPGANIIEAVDGVRAALPPVAAAIPRAIDVRVVSDQTTTIRASVRDVELMLLASIGLVILVVFAFLRSPRTAMIPSVAVPLSLIGTFSVMYLLGYSLDNLSLMALTISTGFVVDDAIVVIENITRHMERGMKPFEAALEGAREIGFTVLSISLSLVAVFIPLLLMGGIVGRLFREFAVTMTIAIVISMAISLSGTPMMCAYLLKAEERHGRLYQVSERAFQGLVSVYRWTLGAALDAAPVTLLVLLGAIALNVYLFIHVPKGFFPQQDTERLSGSVLADQNTSFQTMNGVLSRMIDIVKSDPAVENVTGFSGGGGGGTTTNTARMFIALKPLDERKVSAERIVARLRPKLTSVPGASLYLQASQDVRVGGRQSNAQYQFTMQGDNFDDLAKFAPLMLERLQRVPSMTDVNSDEQNHGLQALVDYDRAEAARYGISPQLVDTTLYDAFGQRQVSTMYRGQNQYHVVMEVAPRYWQSPTALDDVFVRSPLGQEVPLSAFARWSTATAPLSVNHHGLFPAITISFNLAPGVALGDAVRATEDAARELEMPATIHTMFAGTAEAYQQSLASEPVLIATALATVYIVLGILYESTIHPITILSTLPSAGVGALLALIVMRTDLSIIAMIGIILLIGIVKKNAIMMVDFAIAAERQEGKPPRDAIVEACLLRFRPILMTTMAAMLGALPLAIGTGTGSELRRPLGITIIGGLLVSQVLTLYTTPVVYLYFDRLRHWWQHGRGGADAPGNAPGTGPRVAPRVAPGAGFGSAAAVRGVMMRDALTACVLAGAVATSACAVGPTYHRPGVPTTGAFKEPPPEGWKNAEPVDAIPRGAWWRIYRIPELDALEEQISISNQNVLVAMAQYREARDQIRIARSALAPTVTTAPAVTVTRANAAARSSSGAVVSGIQASGATIDYSLPVDLSYQADVWGSVRRSVTAASASAQASEADLENVRLTYQAQLAQVYFQLHGLDGDADLLQTTLQLYDQSLQLTKDRMQAGVASGADVAQAQAQYDSTRAQWLDIGVARAQYEHAIAVLTGRPPAAVSIPPSLLTILPPAVPVGVPSSLLERRPDVTAAERRVAAANEQIGIAQAALYPALTLAASGGFASTSLATLLTWSSRFWAVGPALAATLFDAGKRRAQLDLQRAAFDEAAAAYRQTVLTTFQQVEDQLAALRILEQEAAAEDQAVKAAQDALDIANAQYRAGTVDYLQVISAQTTALQNRRTALDILTRRLTASVLLIEALGGGWNGLAAP